MSLLAGQGKVGLAIVNTDDISTIEMVDLHASVREAQERDSEPEGRNTKTVGEQYDRVFLHDVPISSPKSRPPKPCPLEGDVDQLIPILQRAKIIGAKLIRPGADIFCQLIVDTGAPGSHKSSAIEVKLMVCQNAQTCSVRDPSAQIPQEATHFFLCYAMETAGVRFVADLSNSVSPILRLLVSGGFVYFRETRTAEPPENITDPEIDESATEQGTTQSNQDFQCGTEIEVIALKAIEWVPRERLASQTKAQSRPGFLRLSLPKIIKNHSVVTELFQDSRRWVSSSLGDSFTWVSAQEGSEEFPADVKTLQGGFLFSKNGAKPNEKYLFYPLHHDLLHWPPHAGMIPLEMSDLVTKMLRVNPHHRAKIVHICEELQRYGLLVSKEALSAAIATRRELMIKITERIVTPDIEQQIFAHAPISKAGLLSREISDVFDQAQHQVNLGICVRKSCDAIAERVAAAAITKHTRTVSGLQWDKVEAEIHPHGRELHNSWLATALESQTTFTKQEWERFGIWHLHSEDFIKVGDSFFKPAAAGADAKAGLHPTGKRLKTVLYTICDMSTEKKCAIREMLQKKELFDCVSPALVSPPRPRKLQRGFGPQGDDNFMVRIYSIDGFQETSGVFDKTDPYVRYLRPPPVRVSPPSIF